jgi:hypothetical protein
VRAEQQHTFYDMKKYLSSPLVMKAPMALIPFWLYITIEDSVIGVVLTQVTNVKEHIITYLRVGASSTLKQGSRLLKGYVYPCFMHVLN